MAGPDGAEQQGFCRGNSGCGIDRTPGRHPGRDGSGRRRGGCHVPRARSRSHAAGAGDGRVDSGRASTGADSEGTGMTVIIEPTPGSSGTDVVTGRWLDDHTWNRPSWTVAVLVAAKAGRTISVV